MCVCLLDGRGRRVCMVGAGAWRMVTLGRLDWGIRGVFGKNMDRCATLAPWMSDSVEITAYSSFGFFFFPHRAVVWCRLDY